MGVCRGSRAHVFRSTMSQVVPGHPIYTSRSSISQLAMLSTAPHPLAPRLNLRLAGQHIKERPGAGGKTLRVPSVPSASLAPLQKTSPCKPARGHPATSERMKDEGTRKGPHIHSQPPLPLQQTRERELLHHRE